MASCNCWILLDRDPDGAPPPGIALSPDEKTLYVTNTRIFEQIFAYDFQLDDTVKNRRLLIDLVGEKGLGGPDGLRVDTCGNVYAAATGSLWIISPARKRLGKVPHLEAFASRASRSANPTAKPCIRSPKIYGVSGYRFAA
jgi:gluconolactonase